MKLPTSWISSSPGVFFVRAAVIMMVISSPYGSTPIYTHSLSICGDLSVHFVVDLSMVIGYYYGYIKQTAESLSDE